jgi:hypothetical protein
VDNDPSLAHTSRKLYPGKPLSLNERSYAEFNSYFLTH